MKKFFDNPRPSFVNRHPLQDAWNAFVTDNTQFFAPNTLTTGAYAEPVIMKIAPSKISRGGVGVPCIRIMGAAGGSDRAYIFDMTVEEVMEFTDKLRKATEVMSLDNLAKFYVDEEPTEHAENVVTGE